MSIWGRWARSRAELEDAELREEAAGIDCTPISQCHQGDNVVVAGTVRALSLRPKAQLPQFQVDLYDGTGSVKLVWIGRRSIPGIEAGRRLVVRGRLTFVTGGPTIFNPRYELKPARP